MYSEKNENKALVKKYALSRLRDMALSRAQDTSLESVRCSLYTTMMEPKKAKPHGGLSAGQVALTLNSKGNVGGSSLQQVSAGQPTLHFRIQTHSRVTRLDGSTSSESNH